MGPTWVLSAPDGPQVGPMDLAIRDAFYQNVRNIEMTFNSRGSRGIPWDIHFEWFNLIGQTLSIIFNAIDSTCVWMVTSYIFQLYESPYIAMLLVFYAYSNIKFFSFLIRIEVCNLPTNCHWVLITRRLPFISYPLAAKTKRWLKTKTNCLMFQLDFMVDYLAV